MKEPTGKATPHEELIAEIMDSCIAKNEREWAASREITELKASLKAWDLVEIGYQDQIAELRKFRQQLT